jgi:Spy/CpxP family protein refolding chaperone
MQSKNARLEAGLLVLVVFVLGIMLGGVGGHLWDERVQGQAQQKKSDQINLTPTRNERLNDLTQRLRLTPEQETQVGSAIDDTLAKWSALYSPLDGQKEEIRQQGRAKIRAALTPDQQVKFDDFLRQLDEERKKAAEQKAAELKNAGH